MLKPDSAVAGLMDISGRTAVVTGGAGHIGRTICQTLLELGATVICVDRSEPPAEWSDSLSAGDHEARFHFIGCQLESGDAVRNLRDEILEAGHKVSILVHAAAFVGTSGLQGWAVPFEDQDPAIWRDVLDLNLVVPFALSQALAGHMREQPGACILNIGSIYGEMAPDFSLYEGSAMGNPAAYAASKGGLAQLTRWLSTALAPEIRVNCMSPGGVFRGQPESFVQRYSERTPLGRMASESDFIGAVTYLCTDLSAYVTGQTLMVDGGWGVW